MWTKFYFSLHWHVVPSCLTEAPAKKVYPDQRKEGLFLSCMHSSRLTIPDMPSCPVQVQADVHVVLLRCVLDKSVFEKI
jgi:hypothetical protein